MNEQTTVHVIKRRRGRQPKVKNDIVEIQKDDHVLDSDIEAGYTTSSKERITVLDRDHTEGKKSRAEMVAGDFEYVQNKFVKELQSLYPTEPWRWHCDYYFPHALGGPLWLDEPHSIDDLAALESKQKFLRQAGYRYLVLSPLKTTYDDIKELEALNVGN